MKIDSLTAVAPERLMPTRSGSCWNRLAVVLFTMLLSPPLLAEPTDASGLTTCAVYHRMIAAGHKKSGNRELASDVEEVMASFIKKAKDAAVAEYGEEDGPGIFQENWESNLTMMTDLINRNYKNNRQLKVRYENRCAPDTDKQ